MQHSADFDKLSFGPEDWSDVKKLEPYPKSKLIAEKAAWDFQKALPENEQFDLIMINPGIISGESLVPGNISSTSTFIKFMDGEFATVTDWNFPNVDVKDTALAHLNAIKIEEARNQRFVLIGHNVK
jgi:dihydroflavonol-4-reductase